MRKLFFVWLLIGTSISLFSQDEDSVKSQLNVREVSATSFTFYKNGIPLKLNYFSSSTIDQKNNKITSLVIVVHGNNRNPFTYHENMRAAAEKAGASKNTLIIAPGFIMEKDLNGNRDLLSDDHIFWTNSGWKQGDESVTRSDSNKRVASLSSFEVLDSIIWNILSAGNFPNIKKVVVAGNSAGGQYVNRYLASNLIHDPVKNKFGIAIKYLVAAPSSYTYLTEERPDISTPGKYYTPADTSCNGEYNQYRYGMKEVNEYINRTGIPKYKAQYGKRKTAYFVGALDKDPLHSSLDKSCQAMLQGRNRKERAELFVEYLFHVYGKRWPLTVVPGAGHDNAMMWASKEGMKWLFK